MIEIDNSTILPLALWLKKAPVHNISSIIYLSKINYIATGCENGYIIIWSLNAAEDKLTPHYFLIGHKSRITNLVLAGSSQFTKMEYFVSFSAKGEIALWEAGEGRNIEFIADSQMNNQQIFSYETINAKQRILFCCQKNREVIALNSMSLSIIFTLVCTNSPHWFSSLTAFSKSTKEDVILGTAISGLISMWTVHLPDILNQEESNVIVDAERCIDISTPNPVKITHNPHCLDLILIITSYQFKIYHTNDWDILSYQDCRRGDYFIDGDFLSHNLVLMHTQSGKSFYYELPCRANPQSTSFLEMSPTICENIPTLIYEFAEPPNNSILRHKVLIQTSENRMVIWKGFPNGNIYKWEFVEKDKPTSPILFSLDNSWSQINRNPISLTRFVKDPASTGIITCLLFIYDLSLVVIGMESGIIFIRNISDAVSSAFSENKDSECYVYIKLRGHSGAVMCLLHPSSNMKLPTHLISSSTIRSKSCLNFLKLNDILWSGGADYTIRVWNMKTEQMLTIFHCHSSSIISLKLNSLPLNSTNVCGFSQGFTDAMVSTIHDDEEHSHDMKQMINICMNSFVVGIAENDSISIISVMKHKLLLCTSDHNAPVRNLGWILDSGYLLIDTMDNMVYVWDLSSGIMDRIETGERAQEIMENCPNITKVRSQLNNELLTGSQLVKRHSLQRSSSSVTIFSSQFSNKKLLRFQFINSGNINRLIPVLVLNLSSLLDFLASFNSTPFSVCDILQELDTLFAKDLKQSFDPVYTSSSDFDILISDAKLNKKNLNLKVLLLKIILSQTKLFGNNFDSQSKILNSSEILCTFGDINSKTGCIIFDLKSLFQDNSKSVKLTLDNMLIQLSICNKIISFSNCATFDVFMDMYNSLNNQDILSRRLSYPIRTNNQMTPTRKSSVAIIKSFKLHRKTILNDLVLEYLKALDGEVNDISFHLLEKICNRLIFGILDVCDTISKSSLQLLSKVISNLSIQQIQNYILLWRLFIAPSSNVYDTNDGRNFLAQIHPFLDKFVEYSYLSSDWVWWYTKEHIKNKHEKRNLAKIRIKALLNIALVGFHLSSDDGDFSTEDDHSFSDGVKLFSKLFSLDKSLLARITCDFLMLVLSKRPNKSKSNIGRLINLSMICLSVGFSVWEPYLDSNSVIVHLLKFAADFDDPDIDDKFLSLVSRKAVEKIALTKPILFVTVCYRELLKLQLKEPVSFLDSSGGKSLERNKLHSSHSFTLENDSLKEDRYCPILNRNVLVPIFNDLCQNHKESISDVLPELVEIYVYFYLKEEDFSSFMLPVSKFPSISLNETVGQISVGSTKGDLILFDLKIGKFYKTSAHKKSIKLTKFSDDAKLLASYCIQENTIKIWQISNQFFSLGHHSYQVKMVSSHVIPSLEQMITAANLVSKEFKIIFDEHLEKTVYLEWDIDHKTLFVKQDDIQLKKIRL